MQSCLNNVNTILLLGAGNDVALPVIRALGSAIPDHISIYTLSGGLDEDKVRFPQFSRYITAHQVLQSTNERELVQELIGKTAETGATILLPLNEFYVRTLAKIQDELKDYFYLPPLPSIETFDRLVFKDQLADLLKEYSFPSATSYSINKETLKEIPDDFFPCLLKPIRGSSGQGIQKIQDRKHLNTVLSHINEKEYILQEIIPGDDLDCSFFAIEGEIKAITIQKGLESKGFNFSTAIEFTDNEIILDTVQKLVKITGYSGLAHLDFRLDERDNKPKLIDFNARFWLSLLGSKAAGVNFALLYCLAALGITFDKPVFKKINYMMGMSAVSHYYGRLVKLKSTPTKNAISTDFWGRVADPLPEIARLFKPNS